MPKKGGGKKKGGGGGGDGDDDDDDSSKKTVPDPDDDDTGAGGGGGGGGFGGDGDGDGADGGGNGYGTCKHIRQVRPSALKAVLPKLAEKVMAGGGGGSGVKPGKHAKGSGNKKGGKGDKSGGSSSGSAQWLCLSCGALGFGDSPSETASTEHFDGTHQIGLNLQTLEPRCFGCDSALDGAIADPESSAFLKVTQCIDLVSRVLDKKAKRAGATSTASTADAKKKGTGTGSGSSSSSTDSKSSSSTTGGGRVTLRGLVNNGNTCFFNSTMQCIAECRPLKKHVLAADADAVSTLPLLARLRDFMKAMHAGTTGAAESDADYGRKKSKGGGGGSGGSYNPAALFKEITKGNEMFRGWRQQDAHELWRLLLDGMATEVSEAIKKKNRAKVLILLANWSARDVYDWLETLKFEDWDEIKVKAFPAFSKPAGADSAAADAKSAPAAAADATAAAASSDRPPPPPPIDGNSLCTLATDWDGKPAKKIRMRLGLSSMADRRTFSRAFDALRNGTSPALKLPTEDGDDEPAVATAPAADKKSADAKSTPATSATTAASEPQAPGGAAATTAEPSAVSDAERAALEEQKRVLAEQKRIRIEKKRAEKAARAAELDAMWAGKGIRTYVHDIFSGLLQNTVECLTCHTVSRTYDVFFDVSLPIAPEVAMRRSHGSSSSGGGSGHVFLKRNSGRSGGGSGLSKKKAAQRNRQKSAWQTQESDSAPAPAAAADASSTKEDESTPASDEPTASATASDQKDTTTAAAVAAAADSSAAATATATPATAVPATAAADSGAAATTPPARTVTPPPAVSAAVATASDATALPAVDDAARRTLAPATPAKPEKIAPASASASKEAELPNPYVSDLASRLAAEKRNQLRVDAEVQTLLKSDPEVLTGDNLYTCMECSKRNAALERALLKHNSAAKPASPTKPPRVTAAAATAAAADGKSTPAASATPPTATAAPPVAGDAKSATDSDSKSTAAAPATSDDKSGDAKADGAAEGGEGEDGDGDGDEGESEDSEPAPTAAVPKLVKRIAKKQFLIATAPPILALHLKRFTATGGGAGGLSKCSKTVKFPTTLDLSPYVTDRLRASGERLVYRLYGVVEHSGSMNGGHYVAYVDKSAGSRVSDSDSAWSYASDTHVTNSSLNSALATQAYMLFYSKVV